MYPSPLTLMLYQATREYRIEQRAERLKKNPLIKFLRKIVYLAMIPIVFLEVHSKNTISLLAILAPSFLVAQVIA